MGEREYPQTNEDRLRELRICRGLMLRWLEQARFPKSASTSRNQAAGRWRRAR